MDLPATLVFRGAIQAWEGSSATGPVLYLSDPRSTAGSGPEVVTFTADLELEPGTYVIHATISHDYDMKAEIQGPTTSAWRTTGEDSYPDGMTVYLNNGGDLDAFTTTSWEQWGAPDLSFALTFFTAEKPEPGEPADPADPVVAEPTFTD